MAVGYEEYRPGMRKGQGGVKTTNECGGFGVQYRIAGGQQNIIVETLYYYISRAHGGRESKTKLKCGSVSPCCWEGSARGRKAG